MTRPHPSRREASTVRARALSVRRRGPAIKWLLLRFLSNFRFEGNKMPVDEDLKINKKLLSTLNTMPEPYFTLTIDNETAYGIYECTAKNELGTATKLIKLVEGFRPGNVKNVSTYLKKNKS